MTDIGTVRAINAAKDAAVMRLVVEDFDNLVGVYCAVEALGTVAVCDRVRLIPGA